MRGDRLGQPQLTRVKRQKAHRRKFGRADGEAAQRKCADHQYPAAGADVRCVDHGLKSFVEWRGATRAGGLSIGVAALPSGHAWLDPYSALSAGKLPPRAP